jgi:hypothetical protein
LVVLVTATMATIIYADAQSTAELRNTIRQNVAAHPNDVVVFVQHEFYKSFKGWDYYMNTYGGWPHQVAQLPAVHSSDHSRSRSWIEAGSGVFLLLTLAPGRS